jgi:hypothetical protein
MGKFEYFGLKTLWVTFLYRGNQHDFKQIKGSLPSGWLVLIRNPLVSTKFGTSTSIVAGKNDPSDPSSPREAMQTCAERTFGGVVLVVHLDEFEDAEHCRVECGQTQNPAGDDKICVQFDVLELEQDVA